MSDGEGYLRARISGAIGAELDWSSAGTECIGGVRPADGGIRLRFSRRDGAGDGTADRHSSNAARPEAPSGGGAGASGGDTEDEPGALVLVFGISGLEEGRAARSVPVNVTVIREGRGQFYSTRGDDKCMLDEVAQEPIVGIPHRSRAYRIVARGYCTQPARAVRGAGAVLLSRFDFAGRVDFDNEYTGTP